MARVALHPHPVLPGQVPPRQPRDVPRPFHAGAQREQLRHVDPVPPAERPLADGLPEVAPREPLPARAPLVGAHVPVPQVHHLAERAGAGQLTQDPFEEGRTAPAEPADVEDASHHLPFARFCPYNE